MDGEYGIRLPQPRWSWTLSKIPNIRILCSKYSIFKYENIISVVRIYLVIIFYQNLDYEYIRTKICCSPFWFRVGSWQTDRIFWITKAVCIKSLIIWQTMCTILNCYLFLLQFTHYGCRFFTQSVPFCKIKSHNNHVRHQSSTCWQHFRNKKGFFDVKLKDEG